MLEESENEVTRIINKQEKLQHEADEKKEHAHEQRKIVKREAKKFDAYLEDAQKDNANEEKKLKAKNQKEVLERVRE